MTKPILPNSTIGILGSGQLGRMLAFEAKRMGYRVVIYSPSANSPAGQVADVEIVAAYDDLEKLEVFAQQVDVVTLEFENIPVTTLEAVQKHVPMHPSPNVLHTTQHRLREKTSFADYALPVTPFRSIQSANDLESALAALGSPAILKTAGFGYDGKGQARVYSLIDAQKAYVELGQQDAILEALIDFKQELSVVAARTESGEFTHYGAIDNTHENHILDVSVAPSALPEQIVNEAVEITKQVLESLNFVGVMCVEFFLAQDDQLLINEVAPRPHNSGHLTIEGCVTSQFEQQLRAVCGLSLGSTDFIKPTAMVNLLGDVWQSGEPHWQAVLDMPDVYLHLYGKAEARVGRKMGHITVRGETRADAISKARQARQALRNIK